MLWNTIRFQFNVSYCSSISLSWTCYAPRTCLLLALLLFNIVICEFTCKWFFNRKRKCHNVYKQISPLIAIIVKICRNSVRKAKCSLHIRLENCVCWVTMEWTKQAATRHPLWIAFTISIIKTLPSKAQTLTSSSYPAAHNAALKNNHSFAYISRLFRIRNFFYISFAIH